MGRERTTDSRGNGSSVSRIQGRRPGRRDLRLYGGSQDSMSRTSRTCASRTVAHGMLRTAVARSTISPTRLRFSAAVK